MSLAGEDLIKEIYHTLDCIGTENTIKVLKTARDTMTKEQLCVSIAKKVTDYFSISIQDLTKQQKEDALKEKRTLALSFCVYVLKRYKKLTLNQINNSLHLGFKSRSSLLYYYNIVNKAKLVNAKSPLDKTISENIEQIINITEKNN